MKVTAVYKFLELQNSHTYCGIEIGQKALKKLAINLPSPYH